MDIPYSQIHSEKAVVLINKMTQAILNSMLQEESFRIEITYNAEDSKTAICIRIPKEENTKTGTEEPHQPRQVLVSQDNKISFGYR